MKRHISIFALLLSVFAAVGSAAGAATQRVYGGYYFVENELNGDDLPNAARLSVNGYGENYFKDLTAGQQVTFKASPEVGLRVAEWGTLIKYSQITERQQYDKYTWTDATSDSYVWAGKPDDGTGYLAVNFKYITYTVKYDADGGSGAPADVPGNSYNSKFTVSSTVPMKSGYTFAGWKADTNEKKTYSAGDIVAGSELCKSDWHEDGKVVTMTAQWTKNQYTISTAVEPTGAGSVTGGGRYDFGTQVTLTATANSGWQFEKWKDGGTDNPWTVSVGAADATYKAVFKQLTVMKPNVTKSFTYDGTEKTCATAGDHYTVTGNTGTTVGDYTFTAKLKDGYAWSDGSTADYTESWKITAATITGVTLVSTSVTYDGQSHQPSVASVAANGTAFSTSATGWTVTYLRNSVETSDFKNAGTIAVRVTGTGNLTGSSTAYFTIGTKEIRMDEVVFADLTVTYDGTEKTIKASNVPSGVTATYSSNTRTAVGEQQARVTFEPNDKNHTVSLTQKSATLKIEQATITAVDLNGTSATYDGQSHKPTIGWVTANNKTFSNSYTGWDVTYLRNGAATGDFTSPGTITVTATGNSNLKGTASATFTINKATIESVTLVNGSATYDGKPHQPVVNFVTANGKEFSSANVGWTVAYTRGGAATTDFTKAGTITVAVTGKTGLSGTASATFTINKKTISTTGVSFSDKSVTYDGTAKSITASGVPEGVDVTYSNNSRTDAGSQTATANFTPTDKENCTVSPTSKSATLTVNPAAISAIALNATSATYDGQPHQPQVVSVTANGKTFADAAIGWNVAYDKTDFTSVGNIKVTATGKNNLTGSASATFEIKSKSITVTFDPNGGNAPSPASKTVQYPGTYGTLATCTRKGYDLKGWWTAKEGGTEITSATSVESTANQTLFAHWEAQKYNLTIDPKGGLFNKSTKPTTFEEALTFDATNMNILAVSVKEDGTPFLGYYTSGGIQAYDEEGKCVLGKAYWDGDWPDGKYVNDGDLTVEARWSDAPRYDISVEADPAAAGTATGGGTFEAGTSVTLTATPNEGYSFAGWRREVSSIVSTDNPYAFTASSAAAGTYTAVFTGNVYTVTFDGQRFFKDLKTKPVSFGQPYGGEPEGFVMDGYKIEGWYTLPSGQGVKKDLAGNVDTPADHTLYANWAERKEFDVVWRDLEGGNTWVTNHDVAVTTQIEKADIQTAGWPKERGYSYWIKGWNPPLPLKVKGDTTITAVWESYSDVLDCSNLTFNVYSNWVVNTDTSFCVQDGVSKSCLEFRSFGGGDKVQTILPEKGTISFHWKATEGRTLRVRVPGESGDKPYTATDEEWHEETIHVTNVSGSAFIEFSVDKTDFSDSFCALDAVTWTPESASRPHTIDVFLGEHGKEVTKNPVKDKYDEGETVTLTATEKPGYAFCCWTNDTGFATNDNPWTFTVVDDATYTATFTNCQYVVTLDPNGGTGGASEVLVTYDKPMPQLGGLPTRADGWTFNGYTNTTGAAYYDAQGQPSVEKWTLPNAATLFAQWKAPDEYALTVSVIGRGTVDQDPPGAQHVANTQVKLLATPETGAVFAHWSDGDKNPARTVTMDRDITLTATFTNRQYVVTFDANGGSVSPKTKVVTYGEAYGVLPEPGRREDYKFDEWTMASGDTVTAETIVKTAADHELTAKWTKDLGPYSDALDCGSLKFVPGTVEGWTVCTEFSYKGGSCLRSETPGAEMKAIITESGTMTFWWRGKSVNKRHELYVKKNSAVIVTKKLGGTFLDWIQETQVEITASKESPVELNFVCSTQYFDGYFAIDAVTWTPEGGGEPTPGEAVAPTAAGVADGVFSLTIPTASDTDYGVWTNADLTVDSWGLMGEPQKGEGKPMEFRWTILPGFPQLFFRAHKVEYR